MVVLVLQPKGYAASLIYTPSDRTSNFSPVAQSLRHLVIRSLRHSSLRH